MNATYSIRHLLHGLIVVLSFILLGTTSGCAVASGPPDAPVRTFDVATIATDVQLAASIATATTLSQQIDPARKTHLAEEMYTVAHAAHQAVESRGANLREITDLVNLVISKNTDNSSRAAAGILVNALSLYIEQQLAKNASNIDADERTRDAIRLVSAACQGVESVTASYINPAAPQPSLNDLAGH